jgi:hypothetical protein
MDGPYAMQAHRSGESTAPPPFDLRLTIPLSSPEVAVESHIYSLGFDSSSDTYDTKQKTSGDQSQNHTRYKRTTCRKQLLGTIMGRVDKEREKGWGKRDGAALINQLLTFPASVHRYAMEPFTELTTEDFSFRSFPWLVSRQYIPPF